MQLISKSATYLVFQHAESARPCANCFRTEQVQHLFCGVSAAKQKTQGGLGHILRMPNDTLPKLFGEVKGLRPPGRPRSSFNYIALCDC